MGRLRTIVVAFGLIGASLLATTALSGCGRDQPPQVGTTVVDAADREAMPDISGPTLDGPALNLRDLRGRVVVLNSWASWCGPCQAEMPALVALSDAVDPAAVVVVGLNVNDSSDSARAFAQQLGVDYPSIVDADGSRLRTIPGVPPSALPSTVIIDREGRIAVRIIGETNQDELSELLARITAEGGPPAASPR